MDDEQREIAKLKPLLAEADRQLDGLIVVLNQQNPATLADYPHQELERTRNAMQARWIDWWQCKLEVAKAEYDNSLALYHASQRNSLIRWRCRCSWAWALCCGWRAPGRRLGAEPPGSG